MATIARKLRADRPYRDFFVRILRGRLSITFFLRLSAATYRTLWLGKREGKLSPALSTGLSSIGLRHFGAMVFAILFLCFYLKLVLRTVLALFWILLFSVSLFDSFLLILRKNAIDAASFGEVAGAGCNDLSERLCYPFRHKTTVPVP